MHLQHTGIFHIVLETKPYTGRNRLWGLQAIQANLANCLPVPIRIRDQQPDNFPAHLTRTHFKPIKISCSEKERFHRIGDQPSKKGRST